GRRSSAARPGSLPPADHAVPPTIGPDTRPQVQLWHIIQEKRSAGRELHAEADSLLLAPLRLDRTDLRADTVSLDRSRPARATVGRAYIDRQREGAQPLLFVLIHFES